MKIFYQIVCSKIKNVLETNKIRKKGILVHFIHWTIINTNIPGFKNTCGYSGLPNTCL